MQILGTISDKIQIDKHHVVKKKKKLKNKLRLQTCKPATHILASEPWRL